METLIGAVPESWRVRRLGECCEVQPGPSGSVLKASAYVGEGGVPVVLASDVPVLGTGRPTAKSVDIRTAGGLDRYRLRPGDILLVRVGATRRHAVVTEAEQGWLLGGSCLRLRVVAETTPEYLACYLDHPAVQEWITHHARAGVLSTITAHSVAELPLVLPPMNVQSDVVATVDLLATKIRTHEEVIRLTQRLHALLLPRLLAGDADPLGTRED